MVNNQIMETEVKRDALGNAVLFGNTYGYSIDTNGMLYITIGKAVKATAKGVTLEVIKTSKALYSNDLRDYESEGSKKVNVKSGKLFPVNI